MENILLAINIILAIILVLLVLMQKSEGGALGIGVSQDNFMFSRSAGNFMTKATAIVATLFIICSLGLTIISRGDLPSNTSVIDKIEENADDAPKLPADLENIKLSWETPIPSAPPSDFWNKTKITKITASIIFIINIIFSTNSN